MQPLPSIVTERLELRPLTEADAAALRRLRGNPDAVRFLSHQPLSAGKTDQLLADLLTRAERSTAACFHVGWAVVLRSSGTMIGDGRTWNTAEPPLPGSLPDRYASLGYLLHPDHHGKATAPKPPRRWSAGSSPNAASTPSMPASTKPTPLPGASSNASASSGTITSPPTRTAMARGWPPGATAWTGRRGAPSQHTVTIQRRAAPGDKLGTSVTPSRR